VRSSESLAVARYEGTPGWLYVRAAEDPPYEITGKYLFFDRDPWVLLDVAVAVMITKVAVCWVIGVRRVRWKHGPTPSASRTA
jgi:hypothetical protein